MTRWIPCATVWVFVLIASWSKAAAPPPPAMEALPGPFGVNIHFTRAQPGEMKELAASGFKWIRMDFAWDAIERNKGDYNFDAYDGLMSQLDPHHIRPIFILDYSNRLYDEGLSPHTDEGRAAFAAWAAASVRHFKGRGIVWEMYNEPNIGFWKPKPNVEDYAKLALAVGKAIREAEPDEIYIGPASSTIDLPFLESCFKAGCLEYWSAVSVHPYRQNDPENASADYRKLRQLIAKYAPASRRIPIISGEWGYSSGWNNFDEQRQGKYLPRELLVNLLNDVPVSIWYDWHDDGTNPAEPEHHFGTVHHDPNPEAGQMYDPKPAYLATRTLAESLAGFTFNKRLAIGAENDYVLLFANKGDSRLAVWTTAHEPHVVKIPTGPGVWDVTGLTGTKGEPITADHNEIAVILSDSVQYLSTKKPSELLHLGAAWERLPTDMTLAGPALAHVSARLRNPLPHAITVTASGRQMDVAPNNEADIGTDVSVARDAGAIPVTLRCDVKGLGTLSQRIDILVTNPLSAVLLPRHGKVLNIVLLNPSGQGLTGKAALTDGTTQGHLLTADIDLKVGQTQTTLTLPLTKGHDQQQEHLMIRSADGMLLLSQTFEQGLGVGDFVRVVDEDALRRSYHILPDGSYAVKSQQSVSLEAPPGGPLAPNSATLKITYRMEEGWKFLRLWPVTDMMREVQGQPSAMGLWIFGDEQGAQARMRFSDWTGQMFQSDGPRITFTGWRYARFPLTGPALHHWGGADDGIIHYPVFIDTLILLDSNRRKMEGAVYIAEPTMLYGNGRHEGA